MAVNKDAKVKAKMIYLGDNAETIDELIRKLLVAMTIKYDRPFKIGEATLFLYEQFLEHEADTSQASTP